MTEKPDWRTLPRKPAAQKRSETLTIRLTPPEAEAIRLRAKAAALTLRDWVAKRCC